MGNVITNVVFVEVMGEGDARNLNSGYHKLSHGQSQSIDVASDLN